MLSVFFLSCQIKYKPFYTRAENYWEMFTLAMLSFISITLPMTPEPYSTDARLAISFLVLAPCLTIMGLIIRAKLRDNERQTAMVRRMPRTVVQLPRGVNKTGVSNAKGQEGEKGQGKGKGKGDEDDDDDDDDKKSHTSAESAAEEWRKIRRKRKDFHA